MNNEILGLVFALSLLFGVFSIVVFTAIGLITVIQSFPSMGLIGLFFVVVLVTTVMMGAT